MRAAAWARQASAFTEDEVTVLTTCRVQGELPCLVARNGFHDVSQVLFDLAFGNAQHLRQLIRRQSGAGQKIDHAPARGL